MVCRYTHDITMIFDTSARFRFAKKKHRVLCPEPGKSELEKVVFLFEPEFYSISKLKNIGNRSVCMYLCNRGIHKAISCFIGLLWTDHSATTRKLYQSPMLLQDS